MAVAPNLKNTAMPPLFEAADLNAATAAAPGRQLSHICDHRKGKRLRLRFRFLEDAAAAMPDYEL